MNGRFTTGAHTRERRHRSFVPRTLAVLDHAVLLILMAVAAGVIWILGGNRDWILMPAVLAVLSASILFVYRFLASPLRHEIAIPPGGWISLLFLGYLITILPAAKISYESVLQTFKFATYILAYWGWFNLLRINGRWRWACAIMLLSVSMMACFAIVQDVQGTRSAVLAERDASYGMRASGAYICPNHFAHLLVMIMLLATGLLLSRRCGIALKLFAGYSIAIAAYPLLLTESRSGWIGLMAGLLVTGLVTAVAKGFKRVIAVILLMPLLMSLCAFAVWKISPRVQARIHDAMTVENVRIPLWKDSVDVARLAPWIGNGLGSYRHIYPHYRNELKVTNDPEFAHNEYLHFWSEIGLIGMGVGALMVISLVYHGMRLLRDEEKSSGSAAIPASIMAVIAGSWSHAFFDFNFNIFGNVHVYVFVIAALFAASGSGALATHVPVTDARYRIAGWTLILMLVAAGVAYAPLTASYFRYIHGEARLKAHFWEAATEDFNRAIEISGENWRAHLALADTMRTRAFWMRDPQNRAAYIQTSMQHYTIAGLLNPWSGNVWYGISVLHDMKGDQEAALGMKRKAATEIPRNIFYMNEVGLQLVRMKRFEEALEAFRESNDVEPSVVAQRNIETLSRRLAAPR